jgi:enamine deaminase RidA (YjgF/YER057c/UK114 family)
MRKMMIALALALTLAPAAASAQSFEKKNYNYSEWTKGRFSEAVTVALPGAKMIFLAGVGAEDEGPTAGVIRHLGDFMGQCRYAYDKIKRILEKNGASLADTVKIVTYVTSASRWRRASAGSRLSPACRCRCTPSSTSTSSPGRACWSRST